MLNYTSSSDLYVNEFENACDYLESIFEFYHWESNFKWKWIGISIIQAFYNLCIMNLSGANPINITNIPDKNFEYRNHQGEYYKANLERFKDGPLYTLKWIPFEKKNQIENVFDNRELISETIAHFEKNIISFWSAVARVQDSEFFMNRYVGSCAVKLTDLEKDAIAFLGGKIRNVFIHFRSMQQTFKIQDIRSYVNITFRPMEFLAFETNMIAWDFKNKKRLSLIIKELRKLLDNTYLV